VTEDAARKRSQREGWAKDGAFAMKPVPVTMSPTAATAARVMAQEMTGLSNKSRLGLARGVSKAAERVEKMQGAAILENAHDVKAVAQTASLVHGWHHQAPHPRSGWNYWAANGAALHFGKV
jgi:hypothetical protein